VVESVPVFANLPVDVGKILAFVKNQFLVEGGRITKGQHCVNKGMFNITAIKIKVRKYPFFSMFFLIIFV